MSSPSDMLGWRVIAKTMQKHRATTIAAVQPPVPELPTVLPRNVTAIPGQLLSKEVVAITETTPEVLVKQLACGEISSTAVTKAFLQRAGLASKLVNCCTELLPDTALERAAYLDSYLAEHGQPIGPLHGLPISVKEHVGMRGLDHNGAFVGWVGDIASDDATVLKLLHAAGAVFHARTTQPQTLMQLETNNNIYGTTVNPHNTNLTCGGSSGGEGALIALYGSCLGVGTDIGGSIRNPAANNGLYGLRPTSLRLPLGGIASTISGQESIVPVVGPLSTTLAGCNLFMHALLSQLPHRLDRSLVPLPWTRSPSHLRISPATKHRRLRIGIMPSDGIVTPHPPVARALAALQARLAPHPDIEFVSFPPRAFADVPRMLSSLLLADGGAGQHRALAIAGEPVRPLAAWLLEGEHVRALSAGELWRLTAERDVLRAVYNHHWDSVGKANGSGEKVDVLLCPAGPGVAPPFGESKYFGYLAPWNLLDYPALAFPTGLKVGDRDQVNKAYVPMNEEDRVNYELYSPETYRDAPISLQLVARRYEDEKLVEAMEIIAEVAGLPLREGEVNAKL